MLNQRNFGQRVFTRYLSLIMWSREKRERSYFQYPLIRKIAGNQRSMKPGLQEQRIMLAYSLMPLGWMTSKRGGGSST